MPDEAKAEERRRFNQGQYDMLMRCSDAEDMTEWYKWRLANSQPMIELDDAVLLRAKLTGAQLSGAYLRRAQLSGAKLTRAVLSGAKLTSAQLVEAKLTGAHLSGANLTDANLWGANLTRAHLSGANLTDARLPGANLTGAELASANLTGADFMDAIVDGRTHLRGNVIDRSTSFEGVGLDAARVEPGLKQLLKYNVRCHRWREWCKKRPRCVSWPVRAFWWTSDYGRSTGRILWTFAGLAILYAAIFSSCRKCLVTYDGGRIEDFCHALYFSVVTMTTLGFGDIHADRGSKVGQFLLASEVLIGYWLLAALVTRLAILFQAEGPSARFLHGKWLRRVCERSEPLWRYWRPL